MAAGVAIDLLLWWSSNVFHFSLMTMFTSNVLAVQSSFVASESLFSIAINIANDGRSETLYESLVSSLLLRKWTKDNHG